MVFLRATGGFLESQRVLRVHRSVVDACGLPCTVSLGLEVCWSHQHSEDLLDYNVPLRGSFRLLGPHPAIYGPHAGN